MSVGIVSQFLKNFGNPIVCTSDSSRQNSGFKPTTVANAMVLNKLGHDVYFYVNEGGTKKNEITKIKACFVDLDAGRDANGKYLKPSLVKAKKTRMYNAMLNCPLRPTLITETRNGYQLFWILSSKIDATAYGQVWQDIENKICHYFKDVGSDSRVLKINQLLRVAGTMWNKKYEGRAESFQTLCHKESGKTYSLTQISSAFDGQPTTRPQTSSSSYDGPRRPTKTVKVKKGENKVAATSPVQYNNTNLLLETANFLEEVNKILFFGNHKFLAQQALRLANELKNEHIKGI